MQKQPLLFLSILFVLTGCGISKTCLEPNVHYTIEKSDIRNLPSSFSPLSKIEKSTDWGKELFIGTSFAKNLDLFRAVTSYKRALILAPFSGEGMRGQEIEYNIVVSYYLGSRFQDAVQTFETSSLTYLSPLFPAKENLLTILYDSYFQLKDRTQTEGILAIVEKYSSEFAQDLKIYSAIKEGNIRCLESLIPGSRSQDELLRFLDSFDKQKKSPSKAKFLNAILPGLGYWYVGQKQSAATSFILNALFIGTVYQFFHRGYYAPGLIAASLEFGWYVGGINGAGIEAQNYNNRLYDCLASPMMKKEKLFPVLTFQKIF